MPYGSWRSPAADFSHAQRENLPFLKKPTPRQDYVSTPGLQNTPRDIAIPKRSEVGQGIDSSRLIGLMEVLGKTTMSFLDKQVTQTWRDERVLLPYQFGFQRHRGVAEAARMVFEVLQFARATGCDLCAALSDVRAVFLSVPAWEWRKASLGMAARVGPGLLQLQ